MRRNPVQAYKARRWSFALSLLRCTGLVVGTAMGVGFYYVLRLFGRRWAATVPLGWHSFCRWIFGFRIAVHGNAVKEGPVLYVCNHASYFDVTVLGSLMPARFVAKADVARWPVIGWLCRLQDTLFTSRERNGLTTELTKIRQKLGQGAKIVLFPEGTSGNGNRVLPFKSSIFEAANSQCNGLAVRVQPVTVAYTRLDGLPLGRHLRPFFAWYGDMTLVHHIWCAMGMGDLGVEVIFHEPVTLTDFSSRKEMAEFCRMRVEAGLSAALAGQLPRPALVLEPNPRPVLPGIFEPSWDLG